jgi:flagellar hook-length control protein FliK
MTFNEFLMPALPQTPAAEFKGSGAIRTTAPDASDNAAASDEGQSFLATLKQVSEVEARGAIHNPQSISVKERHHSSEGSATDTGSAEIDSDALERVLAGNPAVAGIQSVNAAPFSFFEMGIMDQLHPLFETPFESMAADISPQSATRFHFKYLMTQIGLNSDAEGKMDMHAQLMKFWQSIAQMTQTNAGAPMTFQGQMTASGTFPVHWTDSIQSLEDLLIKMESHSETSKTIMEYGGKDQAPLPGYPNDSLLAMHLGIPYGEKSKMSRQSRFQARQAAVNHAAIQNPSVDGILTKSAGEAFSQRDTAIKFQVSMADESGAKVFHIEGDNKDSSHLYANDPMLERIFKLEDASRTSEPLQRHFSADTLNQIIQKAVLSLKNGQNEVRIDLKPDFLGHIRMQIVTENQQVAVKIYAESPLVKDMLESNLHQLKAELQGQGLTIDELEVSVGYDSDRETGPNQDAVELKRSKTTGLERQTDSDTSEQAIEANSAGRSDIKETTIDYFA